ncbi:MAG: GNAT family N-acetyltransferase [Rhizobiaceae bacterium]
MSFDPHAPVLGVLGPMHVRLARSAEEIEAAQSLRHDVFFREQGRQLAGDDPDSNRDRDEFDSYCDHLIVVDRSNGRDEIVGTYRLMRQSQALEMGGFYTQTEFDLGPLFAANPDARFLELGRSCIRPEYRTKRTLELLWHGTWACCVNHGISIMFGCASFSGTNPDSHREPLGWLGKHAVLDPHESCNALGDEGFALEQLGCDKADLRSAMSGMPPMIKGYLRLGAKVGAQAVVDPEFGTTDVLVVLKVLQINPKYLAHFGADASRFAA